MLFSTHDGAEDYLSYLAYYGGIAYVIDILRVRSIRMALRMWDIFYTCDVAFVCYTAIRRLAKTAVFLELKTIFTTRLRGVVFWIVVGSLVANALIYTAVPVVCISTCWHRKESGDIVVKGTDSNIMNMATGAPSISSDVDALIVPGNMVAEHRIATADGRFSRLWHGCYVDLSTVWNAEHLLNRFSVMAVGCARLHYRVMLMGQSYYTWLVSQTGLVW
jgi:hypothetical protein